MSKNKKPIKSFFDDLEVPENFSLWEKPIGNI